MNIELQKLIDGIAGEKFAKYSDAKLERFENHKNFMSGPLNPSRGKEGALKGKQFSNSHKAKIGAAHKGKVVSEETRKLISINSSNHRHSEETKEKIRKNSIGLNVGRKHTDEAKRKLSEAKKGTKASEETKKKLSEAQKKRTNHFNEAAIKNRREKTMVPIECYLVKDNTSVGEYESIQSAVKILKVSTSGIDKILNGTITNPRKYYYKYKTKQNGTN